MNILNFLKSKPTQPTIDSYGQENSNVEPEQIQSLMEWLFGSLLNAGYSGKIALDSGLEQVIKKAMRRSEPVFLYCSGGSVSPLPEVFYWRMMDEHPSIRIYQLEVRDDECSA